MLFFVRSLVLWCCLSINSTFAEMPEIPGEFLLFPFMQYGYQSAQESGGDEHSFVAGTDIFYALDIGRFRFLSEVFLDTEEQELERLQVGWKFTDSLTLWIGRYHNHLGYWNTQVHHGLYLQTSISRPGIIDFEDEGGVLASHLTGGLLVGAFNFQESAIEYSLGLGLGPGLDDNVLNPFDILHPKNSAHRLGGTLSLAYVPDTLEPTKYGIFAGYSQIPTSVPQLRQVNQFQSGFYAHWSDSSWRVFGAFFYVYNQMKTDQPSADFQSSDFVNMYLQLEYHFERYWTVYTRYEDTFANQGDDYLALIPNFVNAQTVGGVRFDFFKQHAITLEAAYVNTDAVGPFARVVLQWSAVFP